MFLTIILNLGLLIFCFALWSCYITQSNLLLLLIYFEIFILGIRINFLLFTKIINNLTGYIYIFGILVVRAIETVIGLAIILRLTQHQNTYNLLKL